MGKSFNLGENGGDRTKICATSNISGTEVPYSGYISRGINVCGFRGLGMNREH